MGFWDELEEDDPDFDEAPEEGTSVEDGNYKVVVKAMLVVQVRVINNISILLEKTLV